MSTVSNSSPTGDGRCGARPPCRSLWRGAGPLILASTSESRRALLSAAGLEAEFVAPEVDERALEDRYLAGGGSLEDVADRIGARPRRSRSARCVRTLTASAPIRRSRSKAGSSTSLAISPKAAQTLAALSGKTHRLTSAFCVARAGQALVVHRDHADLRMRALDPAEISRYLERAGPARADVGRRVSGRGSWNSSVRAYRRGSFRCSRTADVESPCLDAPRKSDLAMIETSAPRAGVVGWPIEHSRSPTIHRYWLKELGIPGSYEKFAVRPGEFRQFADKIGEDGFRRRQRHRASQGSRLRALATGERRSPRRSER